MRENDAVLVRCRALRKSFYRGRQIDVLHGVDLEVRAGEFLMLAGAPGSGKTTLVSILAGLVHQDSGEYLLAGESPGEMGDYARASYLSRVAGTILKSHALVPSLSVCDNVAISLLLNGVPLEEALERSACFLDDWGLGGMTALPPEQLSASAQRLVHLARAMVHRPQVLICDEPSEGVSPETCGVISKILREATEEGLAVVAVPHTAAELALASRVLYLGQGTLQRAGCNDEHLAADKSELLMR